jgi:hypothetical protein
LQGFTKEEIGEAFRHLANVIYSSSDEERDPEDGDPLRHYATGMEIQSSLRVASKLIGIWLQRQNDQSKDVKDLDDALVERLRPRDAVDESIIRDELSRVPAFGFLFDPAQVKEIDEYVAARNSLAVDLIIYTQEVLAGMKNATPEVVTSVQYMAKAGTSPDSARDQGPEQNLR